MPGRIQSIERAAAILRLLSGRSRRLGVAELAGELSLPKDRLRHPEDSPGGRVRRAGPGLRQVPARPGAAPHGLSYLDGNELRTRALNWADGLATRSGESVRIGTLHENQVLIVHHVFRPDDTRQALEVGSLLPAHATALGKALLANHDYIAAELADRALPSFTPATVTDVYRFRRELEEIAQRGWASDVGELFQASLDRRADRGSPAGDGRRDRDRRPDRAAVRRPPPRAEFVDYVMEAARAVSRELGAIPW